MEADENFYESIKANKINIKLNNNKYSKYNFLGSWLSGSYVFY